MRFSFGLGLISPCTTVSAGRSGFGSLLSLGHSPEKTDRIYMKGPGGRGEVEVAVSGVIGKYEVLCFFVFCFPPLILHVLSLSNFPVPTDMNLKEYPTSHLGALFYLSLCNGNNITTWEVFKVNHL